MIGMEPLMIKEKNFMQMISSQPFLEIKLATVKFDPMYTFFPTLNPQSLNPKTLNGLNGKVLARCLPNLILILFKKFLFI